VFGAAQQAAQVASLPAHVPVRWCGAFAVTAVKDALSGGVAVASEASEAGAAAVSSGAAAFAGGVPSDASALPALWLALQHPAAERCLAHRVCHAAALS
jgi:hypothetical protein